VLPANLWGLTRCLKTSSPCHRQSKWEKTLSYIGMTLVEELKEYDLAVRPLRHALAGLTGYPREQFTYMLVTALTGTMRFEEACELARRVSSGGNNALGLTVTRSFDFGGADPTRTRLV
jgi:hypothetical protein